VYSGPTVNPCVFAVHTRSKRTQDRQGFGSTNRTCRLRDHIVSATDRPRGTFQNRPATIARHTHVVGKSNPPRQKKQLDEKCVRLITCCRYTTATIESKGDRWESNPHLMRGMHGIQLGSPTVSRNRLLCGSGKKCPSISFWSIGLRQRPATTTHLRKSRSKVRCHALPDTATTTRFADFFSEFPGGKNHHQQTLPPSRKATPSTARRQ
jgi:hypothetical protein